MYLQIDALLCDKQPWTYPQMTSGSVLASFITALKLQAKLALIILLPSQSEWFQKMPSPERLGEVLARDKPDQTQ